MTVEGSTLCVRVSECKRKREEIVGVRLLQNSFRARWQMRDAFELNRFYWLRFLIHNIYTNKEYFKSQLLQFATIKVRRDGCVCVFAREKEVGVVNIKSVDSKIRPRLTAKVFFGHGYS